MFCISGFSSGRLFRRLGDGIITFGISGFLWDLYCSDLWKVESGKYNVRQDVLVMVRLVGTRVDHCVRDFGEYRRRVGLGEDCFACARH